MADLHGKNKEAEDDEAITDETVAEFLKQRRDRIAERRQRITGKLALKKNVGKQESITSSQEFLLATDDDPSGAQGGTAGGTADGKKGTGGIAGAAGGATGDENKLNEAAMKRSTQDPLDVQIDESRKLLEQIILDGESLITNVRIAAEYREKGRHIKFNESKKERCERLTKEAEESQQMYEDLKPNFNITAEHKLPMDLYEVIKAQMQACEELLMKKQDLIDDLQREIEDADFEFEQSLEMYQKDVSLMGDRIDDSMDELMSAFLHELNLIEDYTCRNREVILEENQREWMDLLADFQDMEAKALEERKQDALNRFKLLNELYIQTKQECRAQRHKIEDDLRILIQELEEIKYATQLNMEKLQYNLAILRKRSKENIEMKNMMKRLLLKFNDRFLEKSTALKKKMEAGKKEAKKILSDIAKLEESLDHFGKKTLHLASTDWGKYMDLWSISEEMVRERLKKLLDSEKFIFETQLGMDAPMPELDFMDDRPDVVTKYLMKKSAAYAELVGKGQRSESTPTQSTDRKGSKRKSMAPPPEEFPDYSQEKDRHDPCKSASIMLLPSDSIEFIPGPDPHPTIQRRLMKHLAMKICNESGLLVEEELRRLLEPFIETERNLVNLDAVLKALGINSVTEMQYLAHFMLRRCRVMKGVISRIGSQDSAHLSQMNVSLEGILGKNAWEDWDSASSPSSKTKSVEKIGSGSVQSKEGSKDTLFEECKCDEKSEDEGGEGEAPPPKVMGETDVEVLHPVKSRNRSIDDLEGVCALIPELKEAEGKDPLDLDDFGHEFVQCSPKCCGSEESIEDEEEVEIEEEEEEEEEKEEEEEEANSKCSTCGGEPHDHQDCSFVSSMATVCSWIDPEDPPMKEYKDAMKKADEVDEEEEEEEEGPIEIPDKVIENSKLEPGELVTVEGQEQEKRPSTGQEKRPSTGQEKRPSTGQEKRSSDAQEKRPSGPTSSSDKRKSSDTPRKSGETEMTQSEFTRIGSIPQDSTALEVAITQEGKVGEEYGQPTRLYSDIQPDLFQPPEPPSTSKIVSVTPVSPVEDDTVAETESIASLDSSSIGSEEFMYIDPDEVIDALTEFCKDYNARITVEEPTIDEIIDKKLLKFKYPKHVYLMEYWERPIRMLSVKSDDLWDTMEYCFQNFNEALKKRNGLVDEFIDLYKRNYELSYLLRNHLSSATRRFLPTPSTDSMYRWSGRYC